MENNLDTKMDLKSMNITEEKKAHLKQLFPEVFTESKIDFDRLKQVLGENIETGKERYGMSWAGKSNCFKAIQEPSIATLNPSREKSINFDQTENLFIEGDNLEVLKILQRSYPQKIKMIYIDPPYNTGGDFIYPDNFSESLDTYLKYTGQKDADGRKYSTNLETDGRYHANWMNMMYPRLYLARNLLRNDGVIFISIDDHEYENLKKICNEIFGEENFIESIVWNKRIPKNDKGIGNVHEYILLYCKDSSYKHVFKLPKDGLDEINNFVEKLKNKSVPLEEAEESLQKFYNKKAYDRGITLYNSLDENYEIWGKINLSWPNGNTIGPKYTVLHPVTKRPVNVPDRGWRWAEESFKKKLIGNLRQLHDGSYILGDIWFAKDENSQPSAVLYLKKVSDLLLKSIISLKSSGGIEAESIFGGKNIFPYPKPAKLIEDLVYSCTDDEDTILDFFAGSGTTGHAVMNLNKTLNSNRKYICVQLPEIYSPESDGFKEGYQTISQASVERLKRVCESYDNKPPAFSFKLFSLAQSNFKVWETNQTQSISENLNLFEKNVKPNSDIEDLLYEILLKSGFELTSNIEKVNILGNEVFSIKDGSLYVYLGDSVTKELTFAISEKKPFKFVCLDNSFHNNDQLKTNTVQLMKSRDIDFRTV